MEVVVLVRPLALTLAALVAFACASPASAPAPTPTTAPATAAATATATPTPSAEPGALTFQIQTGSKVTVRVREQLANLPAPSDAVLETTDLKGSFALRANGTFTADSKITAGLQALKSNSNQRDSFIKNDTLDTRRFPTADFVPVRTVGLPVPLPASGEWTFQLIGKMTIRGVEKEVTFEVKAKRDAGGLTATANNAPAWKFADFGMEAPRFSFVLSIVDEIRLELDIVAREGR